MHVTSAESTQLFVGPPDAPLQVVRVSYRDCREPTRIRVDGEGLSTTDPAPADTGDGVVEVAVRVDRPVTGQRRAARVVASRAETAFEFAVAEPGWTMFMISHFHYDPVWWNTQAAYTSLWTEDPPGRCRQAGLGPWAP